MAGFLTTAMEVASRGGQKPVAEIVPNTQPISCFVPFQRSGLTLGELCEPMRMARQSVTKHLKILESANLVAVVARGREKLHYLNAVPIHEISGRWITKYERDRLSANR